MKKEYMRPELTVLSLVVEDNTNLIQVEGTAGVSGNITLGGDDNMLSIATGDDGFILTQSGLFS